MTSKFSRTYSRRSLLTSAAFLMMPTREVRASRKPIAFSIGHGIEVRDVRLFPSPDHLRFVVEIHNTTDVAVDTPTVGVLIPYLGDQVKYGWATPLAPVLHPQSSSGLIGIAPSGVERDADWTSAEWTLCSDLQSAEADKVTPWKIEISHSVVLHGPEHAEISFSVTNMDKSMTPDLWVKGQLWDNDRRFCGEMISSSVWGIEPGAKIDRTINVAPKSTAPIFDYLTNPFTLLDSVEGMSATLSLQTDSAGILPGCPAVMPWNR